MLATEEIWAFTRGAVKIVECDSWWHNIYLFKRYTKNLLLCQGANVQRLHYSAQAVEQLNIGQFSLW